MSKKGYTVQLGIQEYGKVLRLQQQLNRARQCNAIPDTLIFLEHYACLTVGSSGGFEHILADKHSLNKKGMRVYETDRGGNVTYHGPGQLVCYPFFDLRHYDCDVHLYARNLEEAIIRTLKVFGIRAERKKGHPGVWVDQKKIAAQGIAVNNWITMHGVSLNVCPDMEHFSLIVPCGLNGCGVVSMQECFGEALTVAAVALEMRKHFCDIFGIEFRDADLEKILEVIKNVPCETA